jgi:hypothetical protein
LAFVVYELRLNGIPITVGNITYIAKIEAI